ncbi:MAG: META domain-containing protein [Rhodobacteraceae bacterium]|nr:MAG: META domain-containing protein [Paracoccaceae bacterium]
MRFLAALIFLLIPIAPLPAMAAESRSLTGEIMVLERIALPDETVMIVDLSNASDEALRDLRVVTQGRQSPFSFSIEAPQDTDLVLRVGLSAGEDMLWLSEPMKIPAGDEDLSLGTIRALRLPHMGTASLLSCGNTLLEIGLLPDTLRLRINEQVLTLNAQPAASGALYVDPANLASSVHMQGDRALVKIDGAELTECQILRPEDDLTAGVWMIRSIDESPTLFPSRTELVFFPDGRMSATVGCNRLIGSYNLYGGILTFGRIAMTRMACPEALDQQERQFMAALPRIDGLRVDIQAGRLTLLSAGTPVLQARK